MLLRYDSVGCGSSPPPLSRACFLHHPDRKDIKVIHKCLSWHLTLCALTYMAIEAQDIPASKRRSRAWCWTCRSPTVKKGCDRRRPICGRCERLQIHCDYAPRPTLAERRRTNRTAQSTLSPSSTNDADSPSCESRGASNKQTLRSQSPVSLPSWKASRIVYQITPQKLLIILPRLT